MTDPVHKVARIAIVAVVITALGSCANVKPLVVRSVTCCDMKKALRTDPEISFGLEVENPNDFPVTVKSYGLAVRVNGNTIGKVNEGEAEVLPAHATVEHPVTVSTSTKKLISGTLIMGLNALLHDDPTTIEVTIVGSVQAKAKGITRCVKIKKTYPLQMHP